MIDRDSAPTPALAPRFAFTAMLAPACVIGALATGGVREHRVALGGGFEGGGVHGAILSGGEMVLRRPDGVGVVEANYLLRLDDGAIVRLIGTGYATADEPFAGTRMTIVFEVDEHGPVAHLSTRAFVAERPAGCDRYAIVEVL